MPYMHIDFETSSEADLSAVGSYAYSKHPSTRVLCCSYCVVEDPKAVRERSAKVTPWHPGSTNASPGAVAYDVATLGGKLCAHNAIFEYHIWNNVAVPQLKWLPTELEDWFCVMQQAAACNLPQALGRLSSRLCLPVKKQPIGRLLIGALSIKDPDAQKVYLDKEYKRIKKQPAGPELIASFEGMGDRERMLQMQSYCSDDVYAQMHAWAGMPLPHEDEHSYQAVTHRMNTRGVRVDVELAQAIRELATKRADEISEEVKSITCGAVSSARARKAPLEWLAAKGVKVPKKRQTSGQVSPSLDGAAIRRLLMQDDVPNECRRFLELKRQANKSSLKKLENLLTSMNDDGRYRGAMVYGGAGQTTRWSSRGVQLHNIPRGSLKYSAGDYDTARELILAHDSEALALVWGVDSLMDIYASMIRPCIIPEQGREFIISDFSQIEPRVAFWLCDQNDLLDAFRQGRDLYAVIAAEAHGCTYEEAKANATVRQFGKIAVLAGNYGGGAGTFQMFAFNFGIILSLEDAERMVQTYRDIITNVVAYWKELADAAFYAVEHPNSVVRCGKLRMHSTRACLRILLPSGRCLHYWTPRIESKPAGWDKREIPDEQKDQIPTLCYTNHEGRMTTYGGKLFENVVQAVARDPMGAALARLDAAGMNPVLTVHDEAVNEVPAGAVELEEIDALMCETPAWAEGIPFAVDTERAGYYHK